MRNLLSDRTKSNGLLRRIAGSFVPSFRSHGGDDAERLSLLHSLSVGKDCQLLLITCGDERYLVGRGKASIDSIVRIEPRETLCSEAATLTAAGQRWHPTTSAEFAKA